MMYPQYHNSNTNSMMLSGAAATAALLKVDKVG
jgi:hypothetical protein